MKKDYLEVVLKVVIYACSLLLAVLGVSAVTSCSVTRDTAISGRALIVTTDTTVVNHSGSFTLKSHR